MIDTNINTARNIYDEQRRQGFYTTSSDEKRTPKYQLFTDFWGLYNSRSVELGAYLTAVLRSFTSRGSLLILVGGSETTPHREDERTLLAWLEGQGLGGTIIKDRALGADCSTAGFMKQWFDGGRDKVLTFPLDASQLQLAQTVLNEREAALAKARANHQEWLANHPEMATTH